jgi:hypothetical protein
MFFDGERTGIELYAEYGLRGYHPDPCSTNRKHEELRHQLRLRQHQGDSTSANNDLHFQLQ